MLFIGEKTLFISKPFSLLFDINSIIDMLFSKNEINIKGIRMKGDININLKINKKLGLVILASLGIFAMADYVSVVDSNSAGGITVIKPEESAPVGTIAMWGTSIPPENWIELNGQSTSGYPDLANLYGANVPDFRGKFVRAWDNGAGIDSESSRSLLSNQNDAIRNITGYFTSYFSSTTGAFSGYKNNGKSSLVNGSGYYVSGVTFDASKVVPTAAENRPKNISVMYIIRAK